LDHQKLKVVLVTNIYAPYRAPVWNELAEMVDSLDIILLSKTESNRIWETESENKKYAMHILNCRGGYLDWLDSGLYFGGDIRKLLSDISPTNMIVAGYTTIPFIEAILWARRKKIPLVQWYESHALSSRFTIWPMTMFRRFMLHKADSWAVAGLMTQSYLKSMGIPLDKMSITPNTVNVNDITKNCNYLEAKKRTGPARVLYIGRYVDLKRVNLLINAFKIQNSSDANLRLVGYGPMEATLKKLAYNQHNIEFHPPTRNLVESATHYQWADIVVMPSDREVWGLVINEALAAGCYVLSSYLAGVTPDLVEQAPLDVGKAIDPIKGANVLALKLGIAIENIDSIRNKRGDIAKWGKLFTPEFSAKKLFNAIKISMPD